MKEINEQKAERQNKQATEQKLILLGKEQLDLIGVLKVEDFDKNQILLETVLGGFLIKGEDLHISQLLPEEERLSVKGNIVSMEFSQGEHHKSGRKKAAGIFNRLTR